MTPTTWGFISGAVAVMAAVAGAWIAFFGLGPGPLWSKLVAVLILLAGIRLSPWAWKRSVQELERKEGFRKAATSA